MFKGKKINRLILREGVSLTRIFTSGHYVSSPTAENFDMVFVTDDVVKMSSKHGKIEQSVYLPLSTIEFFMLDESKEEKSKTSKDT